MKVTFSFERIRNFCSFQVTHFVVGNLFIQNEKLFTWSLCKVLTKLCLYINVLKFKFVLGHEKFNSIGLDGRNKKPAYICASEKFQVVSTI